jgi:acetyl-CoA carboxylase biotin carboxyl carrier protein
MDGNELKELRELVEFLKSSEIAEFAWSKGDVTLELKFQGAAPVHVAAPVYAPAPAPVAHSHPHAAESAPAEPAAHVVKSPIVGTFYDSPSPGAPPFVKVGDVVEVGQVLCIVEAMKLMNEIEADAAGEIVEKLGTSGQPVEYGQGLFAIKTK